MKKFAVTTTLAILIGVAGTVLAETASQRQQRMWEEHKAQMAKNRAKTKAAHEQRAKDRAADKASGYKEGSHGKVRKWLGK